MSLDPISIGGVICTLKSGARIRTFVHNCIMFVLWCYFDTIKILACPVPCTLSHWADVPEHGTGNQPKTSYSVSRKVDLYVERKNSKVFLPAKCLVFAYTVTYWQNNTVECVQRSFFFLWPELIIILKHKLFSCALKLCTKCDCVCENQAFGQFLRSTAKFTQSRLEDVNYALRERGEGM